MSKIIEITTGLDVESLRIAEQKIANSEDFSSVLIDASLDGIVAYDLDIRFTLWNRAMERITGLEASKVVGRLVFEIFPFLKEQGMEEPIRRSLQGEVVKSPPIAYHIPETGAQGYTEQQNFPLYDEYGKITGGLGVIRDVTAIKTQIDSVVSKNRDLEKRVEYLESLLHERKGPRKICRS